MSKDRPRAIEPRPWTSGVTYADETHVYLRGQPVDGLLGRLSFGGALLLLWRGKLPSEAEASLLEACLVAAVDHGPITPSALVARTSSSTRQQPIACLASGILTMTTYHGAGVGGCMSVLSRAPTTGSLETWAAGEVAAARAAGLRIPGVGHRTHSRDVRSERLLALTFDDDHDGRPVAAIGALAEAVSADAGRRMPVNVDGAIAACLSKLDLDPSYGDLLFAIARSGGLAAHIMEERERQQPMRMIDPTEVRYDGPEAHLESSESAE